MPSAPAQRPESPAVPPLRARPRRRPAPTADASRPARTGPGVALPALARQDVEGGWAYRFVEVRVDDRVASVLLKGPDAPPSRSAETWIFQAFRELEDALLRLRFNHLEVGLINLRTQGDMGEVLAHEEALLSGAKSDWFLYEVQNFVARTLRTAALK